MALSILKPVLFGSIENLIAYLQRKGLLATNKQCPNCASTMVLQRRSDTEDKYRYNSGLLILHSLIKSDLRWRCPVGRCKKSVSLRDGTFFEKTRISLRQYLLLIYWWSRQYPVTDAAQESEVCRSMAIHLYQWLWEICGWRLQNHDDLRLGGAGPTHPKVVEIDESWFGHKPKVNIVV